MGNCENCGGCSSGCGGCSSGCGGCSGCARELVVSPGEIEFLKILGQYAFFPVARKIGDLIPCYLEPEAPAEISLILQLLEKKNLISLDYDKPLKAEYGPAYEAYPIRGSMALTQRGQQVLEMLDYQGMTEE